MDPNVALRSLREAAEELNIELLGSGAPLDEERVWDLVTAAQALDQWLTNGGFLPEDWKR